MRPKVEQTTRERQEQKAMKTGSGGKGKTKEKPLVSTVATKRQRTSAAKKLTAHLLTDPNPRKQAEKIVVSKALEFRLKGMTYQDIADHFGCTKSAVVHRLAPYLDKGETDLEVYKKNRADLLAAKGLTVLGALTESKVKKASARDLAIVYGTLYDKERLERGQSTSNQSVFFHIVAEACGTGGDPKE